MAIRIQKRFTDIKELAKSAISLAPWWLEAAEFEQSAYWLRRGLKPLFDTQPLMASMNSTALASQEWKRGDTQRATELIADAFETLLRTREADSESAEMFPDMLAMMFQTVGAQFEGKELALPPVAVQAVEDFVHQYLNPRLLPSDTKGIRFQHLRSVGDTWMSMTRQERTGEAGLRGYSMSSGTGAYRQTSNPISKIDPQFTTSVAPILPVRSIQAALEHYRRLGFEGRAYEETEADEPMYAFVCLGDVELHLARVAALDPKQTTSACYLYVEDADTLYQKWRDEDVPGRLHAPEDTPYGLREFAHIDPDGNLLRIGSPLPEH